MADIQVVTISFYQGFGSLHENILEALDNVEPRWLPLPYGSVQLRVVKVPCGFTPDTKGPLLAVKFRNESKYWLVTRTYGSDLVSRVITRTETFSSDVGPHTISLSTNRSALWAAMCFEQLLFQNDPEEGVPCVTSLVDVPVDDATADLSENTGPWDLL